MAAQAAALAAVEERVRADAAAAAKKAIEAKAKAASEVMAMKACMYSV